MPRSSSSSLVITVGATSFSDEYSAILAFASSTIVFTSGPSSATTAFCASVNSVSPSAKILSASASTAAWASCSGVLVTVGTTGLLGIVSPRSPNPVARTPPPIRPPAIAASRYSAMASSLSIGRPACDRSSICCPTSVKASVLPPAPTREVVRVSNPFQPVLPEPIGFSSLNPPSNILSATPSSAAWPKVAVSASPTSTLSFAPLATSSS